MKEKKEKETELSTSSQKVERDEAFMARLRILAEKAGSVSALAKASGISQSGMQRYFNGGEPGRKALIAIALAGDVSIEWLATGISPKSEAESSWPAPDPLDAQALEVSVEILEQALEASGYKMPSQDKADLIVSNYKFVRAAPDRDAALTQLRIILEKTLSKWRS